MILDTLAEAFQGEYDVMGSHTVYVSQAKEALVKSEEQEGDIDAETALAALEQESDTDLKETDVQEILLAYKESRQLRGEQRVNCGSRPVTGRTSGGNPIELGAGSISESRPHVHVATSVVRRDTGQVHARTEENKCPDIVKRRRTSEETTARQVTSARG